MNIKLEATHTFRFTTTDPVNGDLQNADSLPTVNVYEEATDTPVLTPTAVNVATGRYRAPVAVTAANGFEAGKVYAVEVLATVGTVAGGAVIAHFRVDARAADDLAFPATSGRSIQVETDGMVHADIKEWLGVAPLALASQRVVAQAAAMTAGLITATEAPNLDAAVSSRLASAGYTAPDNAAITAIDGRLPSDPADQSLLIAATTAILDRLPAALVAGRMDAAVGALAADVITAAAIAAGAITASEAPALANLDAAVTSRAAAGDAMALTSAAVDAVLDEVVEGSLTFRQMLRLFLAALANKSSGGGSSAIAFRDLADAKARIAATVDANGNRTAVVLDAA